MKFFERNGKEIARRAVATLACALMLVGLMPGNQGTMSVQAYDESDKDDAHYVFQSIDETTNISTNIDMYKDDDGYLFVENKNYTITFTAITGTFNEGDITMTEYQNHLTIVSQTLSADRKTYTFIVNFSEHDIELTIKGSPTGTEAAKTAISSVAITGIDTPTAGTALDTTAMCDTAGVETTTPEIKWMMSDMYVSGEALYGNKYIAIMTLKAASGYEFSNSTTATINGNSAKSYYNSDAGTLRVSYTFSKTAEIPSDVNAITTTVIREAELTGVRVKQGDIIYFNHDDDNYITMRVCTVKEAIKRYECTYKADDTDVEEQAYVAEFSKGNTYKIEGDYKTDEYTISSNNWIVYYYNDKYIVIPAAAEPCTIHTYGDASYTWDGTSCTATRKCSVCGDEQKETVTAAVTVTQQASCEQAELSTYVAAFKNSAFATQTKTGVETKAALGHTLGDYTVTKPATIDAAGLKQQICSVCGKAFNDQEIVQLTNTYTPSGASGSVVVEAKPAASVPTTSLATNATDVVTLLKNSNNLTSDELTQVQSGATVKIVLDVADKDATMKADTANLIKAKADSESLEIGQYLDITLTKYINENEIAKIKDLGNNTVTVSMILPDSLIKDGRTYYIIRQHVADDGSKQVALLDTTYYKEAKTITFETSLFSDYAIAYKDSDAQPSQPDNGNNGGGNGSNGGSAAAATSAATSTTATTTTDTTAVDVATTDTTSAALSPKTGEVATTTWLYVLLFASLAGSFGVVSFKRKEQ